MKRTVVSGSIGYHRHVSRPVLTSVRIEIAQADDLPAIVAVSNWAAEHTAANFAVEPERLEDWQASWRSSRERYPWLVAHDAAAGLVGFAKASKWLGRCAYSHTVETSVYIDPQWHGQGIGGKLCRRLYAILRAQGYHTAIAGIALPNPASVALHESLGMTQVATLQRVGWKFGRWHDVGYWQVMLQSPDRPAAAIRSVAEVFRAPG